MADEELKKYRLSSMEEPSDEMLEALMEKVGAAARESSRKAEEAMDRMRAEVASNIAQKKITSWFAMSSLNSYARQKTPDSSCDFSLYAQKNHQLTFFA